MEADTGQPSMLAGLIQLAATGTLDWEGALQQVLRIDAQVLDVERVSFWSLREHAASIFCELGYVRGGRAFERGLYLRADDAPRYFEGLERADILVADDVRKDPRTEQLCPYLLEFDILSMMDVPIRLSGKLVGILCHEHVGSLRKWHDTEQQFALAAAQSIVAALEARARTHAERAARHAMWLADASRMLSQTRDPNEIANRAARASIPILGEVAVVDLVDGERRRLAIECASEGQREIANVLLGAAAAERREENALQGVIRLKRSMLVPSIDHADISGKWPYLHHMSALGVRSAMAVPLVCGERAIGAVALFATDRTYDRDDMQLAEEFAERVAAALENARLFGKLQDAIRAREEFITLVSHELSNPLASLLVAAEALERQEGTWSPDEARRLGHVITRQARHLARLTARIIDASELHIGQLVIERKSVDLAALAREVAGRVREDMDRSGCSFAIDAGYPVWICGDARRLDKVICDLLENAMTFGRGAPIELEVRTKSDKAVLVVRDYGCGIAPERQRDIFERFQRGGISTHAYGGLGLGLYVARGIVEAHGGLIRVESKLGAGAAFIVELPVAKDESKRGGVR